MPDKRPPRKRESLKERASKVLSKTYRHPRFGDVPLIPWTTVDAEGKAYESWQYDPDYQPRLPYGAVRGDVRKQRTAYQLPKYFYVDEDRTCIQCGQVFTFHAAEQKYWYETLGFVFDSVPVRCVPCRRQRRSERALREQIAAAKRCIHDEKPEGHLLLARAIVEYHERTAHGNLDEAIAAAKQAARFPPTSTESSLWEGIAQALAGRPQRARAALTAFLSNSSSRPAVLRTKAKRYLNAQGQQHG
jgi:hypothetical protein